MRHSACDVLTPMDLSDTRLLCPFLSMRRSLTIALRVGAGLIFSVIRLVVMHTYL